MAVSTLSVTSVLMAPPSTIQRGSARSTLATTIACAIRAFSGTLRARTTVAWAGEVAAVVAASTTAARTPEEAVAMAGDYSSRTGSGTSVVWRWGRYVARRL